MSIRLVNVWVLNWRVNSKHEADIVVGVPNSSLSAAMGFAEESGLPNEMGLIKNQYTQRTFIQPTQELREQRGADETVCSFWCCKRQACGYD